MKKETSFVLDFTKQEELEKEQKQLELEESVKEELDALISQAKTQTLRNVAVDASNLKDDRSKNPSQVYEDAKKLQEKLDASRREAQSEQGVDQIAETNKKDEDKKEQTYKGPSVLSYSLKGRKAISLPIPAYKCVGGGDVAVTIIVNRKGYVTATRIVDDASSTDDCLREYAIKAAKRSRFTASEEGSEREVGEILYRFIPQ